MKLTLIRTDRETGKESFSTLEAENLIAKIKKENKAAHVSALRHLIPILQGTNNHYQNIDKLPRIYPRRGICPYQRRRTSGEDLQRAGAD